jgi:hypothetical protein
MENVLGLAAQIAAIVGAAAAVSSAVIDVVRTL